MEGQTIDSSRNLKVLHSSNTNEWETPQKIFEELNKEFNFTLDPCSTHKNAKCEKHFTIEDDGLTQDWSKDVVFCNPPYRNRDRKMGGKSI